MALIVLYKAIMNPISKRGFTLVEIMIVVAIIGLLAALGIPSMLHSRIKARATRFANDIQRAGHAFVQYSFDNGSYPLDKNPAQMPDGMAPYLTKFSWFDPTAIGGQWDWDYGVFGITAGVSVHSPNWGSEQMKVVDQILDDGNLSTGLFRQRSGGYIYILEQ